MQMPKIPISQLANDGRMTALWLLGIISFVVLVLSGCLALHIGNANNIIDDLGWGLKIGMALASGTSLGHTILNKKGNGAPPAPPPISSTSN